MDKTDLLDKEQYDINDLINVVRQLRAEDGCPWDKVQTHQSLKDGMIEEGYEVIEAIDNRDNDNLKEELGDVLLQVVMHSQIADENGEFNLSDVISGICKKMIFRHPHVFGNTDYSDVNWEELKTQEKLRNNRPAKDKLSDIPKSFPALLRAQKVLKKCSKTNYKLNSAEKSIDFIQNNISKLQNVNEYDKNSQIIGECIMEMANLSRIFQQNAEIALTNVTEKFINKREGNIEKK